MDIRITSKNGVVLKTANKYCAEDINVAIDSSLLNNDVEDTTLLGNTYTFIETPDVSQVLSFDLNYFWVASDGNEVYGNKISTGYFATAESNAFMLDDYPFYVEGHGWENEESRTLMITGGADVENPEVISYFEKNATKIDVSETNIETVNLTVNFTTPAGFGSWRTVLNNFESKIESIFEGLSNRTFQLVKGTMFVIYGGEGVLLTAEYALEGNLELLQLNNDVMIIAVNGNGSIVMTNDYIDE